MKKITQTFLTLGAVALVMASPMRAEDEKELGWFDTAELSYVLTAGNAEAETLGFRNSLRRVWADSEWGLEFGGLKADSSTITRTAIGTVDSFTQNEVSVSETTAENYFFRTRYDRVLSERLFWFVSGAWDRNEFAGIKNRYIGIVGLGHVWFDNDTSRFRTDYGVTYTQQDDVVENPDTEDGFLGFRLGYDYWRQVTGNTEFGSVLIVDGNVDDTDDYRADFVNFLAVSMSERLALKVSLQWLYDNQPSLTELPLFTAAGAPTDLVVFGELDDVDTIFTTALVINF